MPNFNKSFNNNLAKKLGLSKKEISTLRQLSTPEKIQDFLGGLRVNLEKKEETLMSPRLVLEKKTCHCIEGALLAALSLWLHGKKPLLLDMRGKKNDFDHVVAIFKIGKNFGAISKTNHATIRYRDGIYKSLRELVMSYFHEYTLYGEKTLLSYSKPFDLSKVDYNWPTSRENLWYIDKKLDSLPHYNLLSSPRVKLRKADKIEVDFGDIVEYK